MTVSDLKITVTSNLCADSTGVGQVEAGLKTLVQEDNIVTCITGGYCSWGQFTCTHDTNVLTVGFTLTQTHSLSDKTLVTADEERIKTQLVNKVVQVNTGKKRATESGTINSVTVVTDTTCSADRVEVDDSCILCPAGWGLSSSTCNVCAQDTYSTGDNMVACTQCSGSTTTHNAGSTKEDDCVDKADICEVKASTDGATYTPPAGSRIKFSDHIKVHCGAGKATADGVESSFRCGANPPQCYGLFFPVF